MTEQDFNKLENRRKTYMDLQLCISNCNTDISNLMSDNYETMIRGLITICCNGIPTPFSMHNMDGHSGAAILTSEIKELTYDLKDKFLDILNKRKDMLDKMLQDL